MARGLAILDLGHQAKESVVADPGAQVDLDGDGRLEASESEVVFARQYMLGMAWSLGSRGHDIGVAGMHGSYAVRHQRVVVAAETWLQVNKGRVAYVQGHLNIGASRGMVFHDSRSSGGARLASAIVARLGAAFPALAPVSMAAEAGGPWANALACVAGIYRGPAALSGVCLEPLSLDRHRHMLDHTLELGRAMGDGVADWLEAA